MRRMKKLIGVSFAMTLAASTAFMPAGALAQDASAVKVGVLTDISGQFSHESGEGAVTAVKMAVEDYGGKVLGKPVEVVVADHQNKPEVAVATAKEWYEAQGVTMIANLINSGIALAVAQVAKEENGIAIVNGSGSSRLTGDGCTPNSIHYAYDTYALANGTANELIKQGKKNWYFLTADYAFGHALEADATTIVKANGGEVSGRFVTPSRRPTTVRSCFRRRHRPPRWLRSRARAPPSSTPSNRPVNSVSAFPARPSRACLCGSPTFTRSALRPRRA